MIFLKNQNWTFLFLLTLLLIICSLHLFFLAASQDKHIQHPFILTLSKLLIKISFRLKSKEIFFFRFKKANIQL